MGCVEGAPARYLAELVQSCEAWAISGLVHGELTFEFVGADVESPFLLGFEHVVVDNVKPITGEDIFADKILEVVDVLGVMEFEKFLPGCFSGTVHIKFPIDIEALDKGMGHRNSSRFHGMVFVVIVLSYLLIVEVCHIAAVQHFGRFILLIWEGENSLSLPSIIFITMSVIIFWLLPIVGQEMLCHSGLRDCPSCLSIRSPCLPLTLPGGFLGCIRSNIPHERVNPYGDGPSVQCFYVDAVALERLG